MASSSSAPQWKYDVFMSFRGEDTRKNFVDHLYDALLREGIHPFKDDERLEKGKEIPPELLKSIEQSRLALIIFSEHYASSSWCLDELVKILECKKMKGQEVLPIFHKVDPSEVRKQKGSFGAAFAKHEEDYSGEMDKVKRWRTALTEAANISGWDTQKTADGHESKCIQEIVRGILANISHTISNVVDLVGIESRAEEVCSLLETSSDDVRVIGIWGMGGIGKTTIARAVYDQISYQFEDRIFLTVKEILEKQGLEALQRELFSIAARLRNGRVLAVLDDVDQISELEFLPKSYNRVGSGSRIIITTRDARLLVTHGVDVRYEVKALDENEALQLFSLKAFANNYPPEDYKELSDYVVHYTAGLPLALKVLGSSLYLRNKDEWKSTLSRLKRIPNKNILQVLKISFDRLDEPDQQIFLDIACFFNRAMIDLVKSVLGACDFEPDIGLRVLIEKSLITVSNNRIQMHPLIQEMGLGIVRNEDPKEPGKRSRLWLPEDVCHALLENTVTDAVETLSLCLHEPADVNTNTEVIKKMNKLRLLCFRNVQIRCSPNYLPNTLRLLNWQGYPSSSLPTSFNGEKLVVLFLEHSQIIELWKETKIHSKLNSVNLYHSQKLRRTPDFTGLPNLETLILDDCTSLVDVHPSISFHRKMKFLSLRNCTNLRSLADAIQLKSLEVLDLSGCHKLKKFPVILGNMDKFSRLFLSRTAIKELPSSIEKLSALVLICLDYCRNLACLPDSICNLKCLQKLHLWDCLKLEKLPENLGEMERLELLCACKTSIKQLPSSIVLLKKLKFLCFQGCNGPKCESRSSFFPPCFLPSKHQNSMSFVLPSLSGLSSLTVLDLRFCKLLDGGLPSDIGCLPSLLTLDISGTNVVNLPTSISQLSRLESFLLVGCNNLEKLPKLPPRIERLHADHCTSLERLPDLSAGYEFLTTITLSNCFKLLENHDILADTLLQCLLRNTITAKGNTCILLPGREIPNWFKHQNIGKWVSAELPPHWYNDKMMGLAFCVIFEMSKIDGPRDNIISDQKVHLFDIKFTFKTNDCNAYTCSIDFKGTAFFLHNECWKEHLCLCYLSMEKISHMPGLCDSWDDCCRIVANLDSLVSAEKVVPKMMGIRLVYQ